MGRGPVLGDSGEGPRKWCFALEWLLPESRSNSITEYRNS